MTDNPQLHDHFGYSLTAGNFTWDDWNGNPLFDPAIGVPGEDDAMGAVPVLYPWADTGLDCGRDATHRTRPSSSHG